MSELQLNTQELQASYGIGLQMGEQLAANPFDGLEISAIAAGISDAFAGAESKVSREDLQAAFEVISGRMQAAAAEQAEVLGAAGAAFKTGLLGLGKGATKKVATEVAKEAATGGAPPHFFKLVAKIKALGDDVTETAALAERQNVKTYKDFELTEDIATGRQEVTRYKVSDESSYYGQPLTEETYMSYTPGETIIGKSNKPVKTLDDYEEGTAFVRNDRGYRGEIVDESTTISDDIFDDILAVYPPLPSVVFPL
jgi:hypothetical protein